MLRPFDVTLEFQTCGSSISLNCRVFVYMYTHTRIYMYTYTLSQLMMS